MWLLTYVGALFNGLTLLILGEVILTMQYLQLPSTTDDSHVQTKPNLSDILILRCSSAVVSMFTLPVVYEKHQVGL